MSAYFQGVGWIVFWVAVVVLGLLVIPVMNNPGALLPIIFAIIVLGIGSALWGIGAIGREMAVKGAALVLALYTLSFFLPLTAKRVPEKVSSFDKWLTTPAPPPAPAIPPAPPEFPTRGEGVATKDHPVKAWLRPSKGETRPTGKARYVFVDDPTLWFNDLAGARLEVNEEWRAMPEGKYLVYPFDRDQIFFRWW